MGAGAGYGRSAEEQSSLEARIARLEAEVARLNQLVAQPHAAAVPALEPAVPPLLQTPFAAAPPPPLASPPGSLYPPPTAKPELSRQPSFEDRLGSQWFNRIGIALLLLGTSWFLKLAIDRGWIVPSPAARVIAGLLAGAALVLWSERFRRRGFAPFSYSLKALGTGVLYLSLWAAFRLYGLIPSTVALLLMIAVTVWNAFMAWAQNTELLAAYALAGGFATPLLLSTGGNHEVFLFVYLLALDVATVALVRLKSWPRLLLGSFPLTVAWFVAWYVEYFSPAALGVTSVFIALFGAVFLVVPLGQETAPASRGTRSRAVEDILLPLGDAAFVALAFYSVLQDSGHHSWLPWMVLLLGAVYLAVMRAPQSRTAAAMHLSLAVVLLTIAIPLKASGHWITAGWLVEGLALVWVSTRLGDLEAANTAVLRWLAAGALALGVCGALVHLGSFATRARVSLWTSDVATGLLAVLVLAGAAWLARDGGSRWRSFELALPIAVASIALMLAAREVVFSWSVGYLHPPLRSAAFGAALLAIAVFAGLLAFALAQTRQDPAEALWPRTAGWASILLNLTAVLTGVREVAAIWPLSGSADPDAALKQGLAISGFLMFYGALLLADGFWRHRAFLRWQGLILLLFTILKAFLYDMRDLSQGYRVASFLALGALLMTVSYAYQRDWLALRPDAGGTARAARSDEGPL